MTISFYMQHQTHRLSFLDLFLYRIHVNDWQMTETDLIFCNTVYMLNRLQCKHPHAWQNLGLSEWGLKGLQKHIELFLVWKKLVELKMCVCNIQLFFPFFFAFPSYISGVHHFWVRFLRMWPFFNPTIKVVTFRLRGWCVLGVFLLPASTRLGHERQDLLSPCNEMHVCTD